MILFEIYRSASTKVMALSYGELGFTQGKYDSVADIDNPAEILEGMTQLLEPYVFSENIAPPDVIEEVLNAYMDFQEAFDVDMQDEIIGLKEILDETNC